MHYDWVIVSDGLISGVGRKWKRSDSSDSDSVALMTLLTTSTSTPSLVKTSLKAVKMFKRF